MTAVFDANQLMARQQRQQVEAALRGWDHLNPKKYNILFIGDGGVTQNAINLIANNANKFIFDIDHIYIVGRVQEGSVQKREKAIRDGKIHTRIDNNEIKIKPRSFEYLEELLQGNKTDLVFFTLDKNPSNEYDRSKLSAENISLVEKLKGKVKADFTGIINFVSNLPEVLAAYATQILDIDPRQITANVPLDLLRAESIIYNEIREEISGFTGFEIVMAGFHDQIIPFLEHSKIWTGYTINKNTTERNFKTFNEYIARDPRFEGAVREQVSKYAKEDFELLEAYLKAKGFEWQQGATIETTGAGIFRFTQTVINGEKTITGIPELVGDKYYFKNLPVTFENGFPQRDEEVIRKLSEEDKRLIDATIVDSKHTTPNQRKNSIMPKTLQTIIEETTKEVNRKRSKHDKIIIACQTPRATDEELAEKFGKRKKLNIKEVDEATIKHLQNKNMKKVLEEGLYTTFALKKSNNKTGFTYYEFAGSIEPFNSKPYQVRNKNLSYEEEKEFLRKSPITKINHYKEHIYATIATQGKNNLFCTLGLVEFEKNNGLEGQIIWQCEKPMDSIIEEFIIQKNQTVAIVSTPDGQFLERIDQKGKIRETTSLPEQIYGFQKYKEGLLLIGEENVYQYTNKWKKIAPNNKGREYELLSDRNILLTMSENRANIIDLEKGLITSYPTTNYLGTIASEKKYLQLATSNEEGIVIQEFRSKEEAVSKESKERFIRESQLEDPWKIYAPRKNVLITFHQDNIFATSHNDLGQLKTVNLVSGAQFLDFGGFFEK
ncbi:hypothetical protein K9M74_00865 [Candidatus Woesearchaeota archaeon]|nr:hypothetical protein [Candidatus Woesearchaeota archaeon]